MIRLLILSVLALPTGVFGYVAGAMTGDPAPAAEKVATAANLAVTPAGENGAVAASSDDRVLRRAPDGLFHVDGWVNGTPVRFIVDTGATTVVLAPRDAARLGMPSGANGGTMMKTVGGSSPMHWTRVERIEIAGHRIDAVDAAVVGGSLEHSLLGQNVLSRMGAITIDGDRLTISPPVTPAS